MAVEPATAYLYLTMGLTVLSTLLMAYSLHVRRDRAQSESARQATVLELQNLRNRIAPIPDLDAETARLRQEINSLEANIEKTRADYRSKRDTYDALVAEAAIYDEEIELAELGHYTHHFDFDDSDRFKDAIKRVRQRQKEMLKAKDAVYCRNNWQVNGSRSEGKKMEARAIKLTTRAFNNECDAAINSITWKNAMRLEERIQKADLPDFFGPPIS